MGKVRVKEKPAMINRLFIYIFKIRIYTQE